MGMVSRNTRAAARIRLWPRRDRNRRGLAAVGPPGRTRAHGKRCALVLARHDAVGAIHRAVRAARRLYHQPPAFLAAVDQSLGAPGVVPESRGVLAQPGDADDAV